MYYVDPRHPAATDEPAWGYPAVPLASLAKAWQWRDRARQSFCAAEYTARLSPRNDGVTVRAMQGRRSRSAERT